MENMDPKLVSYILFGALYGVGVIYLARQFYLVYRNKPRMK